MASNSKCSSVRPSASKLNHKTLYMASNTTCSSVRPSVLKLSHKTIQASNTRRVRPLSHSCLTLSTVGRTDELSVEVSFLLASWDRRTDGRILSNMPQQQRRQVRRNSSDRRTNSVEHASTTTETSSTESSTETSSVRPSDGPGRRLAAVEFDGYSTLRLFHG